MKYDAILFDFDGVLADTEPIHYACWTELIRPLGIEMDWETYSRHGIGVTDMEFLRFVASCTTPPADVEEVKSLYPVKEQRFIERILEAPPISDEVHDLLKSLAEYRLALVTSSPKAEIEPIVSGASLDGYFDTIIYGGDVTRRKPHPEPYLLAASRLQAKSPLVVEDSDAGERAGRAAGFPVLRVPGASSMPALLRAALRNGS